MSAATRDIGDYSRWISLYGTLQDKDRSAIKKHIVDLPYKPLISVIMPAYESDPATFEAALRSVTTQLYPNWELCVVDDASPSPHVSAMASDLAAKDPRVKWSRRAENGHIAAASNTALELASGEFVALMDHDDLIPEHALYEIVVELNAYPETDIIFTDEDRIGLHGERYAPYFKSGWDRELFLEHNFLSHLCAFRRSLVDQIEGFREGFEGSQDYDLSLRAVGQTKDAHIRHIPSVLYHWRAHTKQFSKGQIERCIASARRSKREYLAARGVVAEVAENAVEASWDRVRRRLLGKPPFVTLIINASNASWQLEALLRKIKSEAYDDIEIIVRGRRGHKRKMLDLAHLGLDVRFFSRRIGISRSASANLDVENARGSIVGFLSDDMEPLNAGWLSDIVALAEADEFGVIGGKVFAPDDSIRAAGYVLSPDKVAIPIHSGAARCDSGYFGRLCLARAVSALSLGGLFLRRSLFEAIGGFDPGLRNYADVDLCMKVFARGHQNVWTPFAEFKSHKQRSRGWLEKTVLARDRKAMKSRWATELSSEAHYNPNLALNQSDIFRLAFPPRTERRWMSYL